MAFVPNVNWVDDEPPGFDSEEMIRIQTGIADAAQVADGAAQAAADAAASAAAAVQSPLVKRIIASDNPDEPLIEGDLLLVYDDAPAPVGDTYYTNFSEFSGGIPAGWSSSWTAATWSPVADSAATGGWAVETTGSGRRALLWDQTSDVDQEVVARVMMSTPLSSHIGGGVIVRGQGPDASATGYAVMLYLDRFAIVRYSGGVYTELTPRVILSSDIVGWYWVRLRAQGSEISASVWFDGDPEPAEWMAQRQDSTIASAGSAGLVTATNSGTQTWDVLGVATGGATAPKVAP